MDGSEGRPVAQAEIQSFIPVYRPNVSGNERTYVLDCIETGWISSLGSYSEKFPQSFKRYVGANYAIPVCNGTVALHLALHCLDIGPGDEVLVPTFTYIASVNTIAQTGARPVFVDSDPDSWLVSVEDIERKITARTKAIMAVHLYGAVCDMPAIMKLARRHGIAVVEDCAEALGSTLNGVHVGNFGTIGTFSFFGNKTITTGEGGMVICADETLAQRMLKVRGQGQSFDRRYWHDEIGFNYRMTNICAAIGLAQLERVEVVLARKAEIARRYRDVLSPLGLTFQCRQNGVDNSEWLVSFLLPNAVDRNSFMSGLQKLGIDTRPVFYCAHQMPMYQVSGSFPVAEEISRRGVSLPSYPDLSNMDVDRVIAAVKNELSVRIPATK